MSVLCFILLAVYLGKCSGETHFIYTTQDKEEKFKCETNKWQISTKSDNTIDLSCSVQCETDGTVDLYDLIKPSFCSKDKVSQPGRVCSLEVMKSGYYSCVKSLDPGFLFPFKSSPNVIQSYIIAVQNSALTLESERRSSSSVSVAEGESVILNCSLSFTPGYNINNLIVYWIKTVEQSSTCIYSSDYDHNKVTYGHHCDEPPDKNRFIYQNEGQLNHDIKISKVKSSDSGQYRCALQMDTGVKEGRSAVNWKVIEDVTLNVYNPTPPHSTDQPETPETPETTKISETTKTPETPTIPETPNIPEIPETPEIPKTPETPKTPVQRSGIDPLMPLYTSWPVCLGLLLAVWVVFVLIRRKTETAGGSEAVELQSL